MPFFAYGDSWEKLLVFVGFILISAISNWLKKRGIVEPDDETRPLPPRPGPRPPGEPIPGSTPTARPIAIDWQKELSDLLGGETVHAPPPRSLAVPPPLQPAEATSAPPPTPLERTIPPSVSAPGEESGGRLGRLAESAAAYERAAALERQVSGELREVEQETETISSYDRARELARQVSGEMREVDQETETFTVPEVASKRRPGAPEITPALALLKRPDSARQAFIVSQIFGPPKSLQSVPDLL